MKVIEKEDNRKKTKWRWMNPDSQESNEIKFTQKGQ